MKVGKTGVSLFKSIRGKVSVCCGISRAIDEEGLSPGSLSIEVGTSLCTADCVRE